MVRGGTKISRVARLLFGTVALAALMLGSPARAGQVSPGALLEAMPAPALSSDETRLRYLGGVDRAMESVHRASRESLAQAVHELGRGEPFDKDAGSLRAAAHRLTAPEANALLEMERLRTAEPVDLARPIEDLARLPRLEAEQACSLIEERLRQALSSCRADGCTRRAQQQAREARAELLAAHLSRASARWEALKARVGDVVTLRQRLAERVATATSDPYLLLQAKGLLAGSWRAVAELADEVERETALVARLSQGAEPAPASPLASSER
jgi:hypothetical protein